MDAAIVGLIGSLAGVMVGATAQGLQASRTRRWQVADLERTSQKERQAQLWQDRRVVYAAFMAATLEVTNQVNWIGLHSAESRRSGEVNEPLSTNVQEALTGLSEMIKGVFQKADEVRLITESDAMSEAVSAYIQVLVSFNPSASRTGESDSPQGYDLTHRLIAGRQRFIDEARKELGMRPEAEHHPLH